MFYIEYFFNIVREANSSRRPHSLRLKLDLVKYSIRLEMVFPIQVLNTGKICTKTFINCHTSAHITWTFQEVSKLVSISVGKSSLRLTLLSSQISCMGKIGRYGLEVHVRNVSRDN